jgi:hypothetical protein
MLLKPRAYTKAAWRHSWLIVEINQYNLNTVRKQTPGPQSNLHWSGEDEQQVARQKGVAGVRHLLRRSAQEITEKTIFTLHEGKSSLTIKLFTL